MRTAATVPALLGDSQRPALVDCDGGWTLSHTELREAVEALAEQLYELGVRPGDGVAIVMANSAATIVTFLAVVRASAIAQPINSQLRRGEVEAEPVTMLTSSPSPIGSHATRDGSMLIP